MELGHTIWHVHMHVHEASGGTEREPGIERGGDRGLQATGQMPPFITLVCTIQI